MATIGREQHSRNRKEHMHSYINWDLKMMKTKVVGHDLRSFHQALEKTLGIMSNGELWS